MWASSISSRCKAHAHPGLGGNGFIGSHLVDLVRRHGHCVRVFDRHPERYRAPLDGVEYVFGDFGNREEVSAALEGIDLVYHLVGDTLPQSLKRRSGRRRAGKRPPGIALLEECVARGVSKVLFVSSGGTVYGIPQTLPVHEDSPTWPICSYGVTKLCLERYFALFHHLHGLEYAVVRPSNAFGPRQNPEAMQGVISVFMGRILEGRGITIWGDGSVVRDYLFVQDLVEGIYSASVATAEHRVFNLGSGQGIALNELVAAIDGQLAGRTNVEYAPKRVCDVPAIYLDVTRARDELAWQPRTSLEDGIAATLEFLSEELTLRGAGTTSG